MSLLILFVSMTVFCLFGMPVAYAMGLSALVTMLYDGVPAMVNFQRMVAGMNIYALLAIPFFIYAGELMLHGGIAERVVRLASALIGRVRGGLGIVNVMACMLFGGISGSAVADASAIGSIMIPMMKRRGYDADYAVNVTSSAALTGILIPPSHNMIIYSLAAGGGVSVASLFMAGVVPGILMGLCLMVAAYWVAVRRGYPREAFPGWRALLVAAIAAVPGLLLGLIILGGVLSGVFTVTESAGIGVIYAAVVTGLVYRSLSWADFKTATYNAVRTTAMVMLVIGTGNAVGWILAFHQVPALTVQLMQGLSDNPYVILFAINVVLLLLGTAMDMAPLILICTPIFLPVVKALGMDPLQFGVILMINLGLGLLTPPVGPVLFVCCAIGRVTIEATVRTVGPFYLAMFVALMLVTYVPEFSLWLPRLLFGG
ncbi:MAG: TRAP transporter large permease [Alphaproteobacteria bacterium]|nr:TRAP transporter large permease [Alphaproteobacteria bacterium]